MVHDQQSEALGSIPSDQLDIGMALAHLLEAANLVLAEADRQESDRSRHIPPLRQLRAARDQAVDAVERWPEYRPKPKPARFTVTRPVRGFGDVAPTVPFGGGRGA